MLQVSQCLPVLSGSSLGWERPWVKCYILSNIPYHHLLIREKQRSWAGLLSMSSMIISFTLSTSPTPKTYICICICPYIGMHICMYRYYIIFINYIMLQRWACFNPFYQAITTKPSSDLCHLWTHALFYW